MRNSSTSDTGGKTKSGSGISRTYGGGRYYAGGATVPYTSGVRSPLGIKPFLLSIATIGIFSQPLHYGVYAYPFIHHYYYRNPSNGTNTSVPITCLCEQYAECGCDDNGNTTYIEETIGNGTGTPQNSSLVRVISYPNGTTEAYLNGTLDNGTTASGGTAASSDAVRTVAEFSGYWVMVATVVATVMLC